MLYRLTRRVFTLLVMLSAVAGVSLRQRVAISEQVPVKLPVRAKAGLIQ